ncbi:E3 ubiquitin-protein ligase TRIM7-like [Anolis carolinensis]|uniref:E3 ubiquitin-protein ligase TRIM7-like n=1 Tax=Anolis carolinensis TaxID=28377 RepID=UPI002F2B7B80
MASGHSMKKLCLELSCPICLEYFKEPLSLSCGHNFCQSCLDQCWEGKEASCPQCREKVQEGDIRPNRQLAKVVEIVKELGSQKAEEKGSICQKHQEPLKLFCKDHETPICVVCDKSKEHKNHKVIPLDEASKEYKDQIWNFLETLKKEREKIPVYKADAARESQDLLKKTQREKDKTAAAFRRMHQFLEEQERNLLAKMDEVEKEISAKGEEHLARLSEELSSLSKLIQEMEEKHQQPASELLQDIRSFLQGCKNKEKSKTSAAFPPALKWKIWDVCDINPFLKGVMKQFRASLESGLQQQKAHVTLDPDTAHPQLILSEDLRRVIYGEKEQDLPDNPERFCDYAYVLGQDGFTEGRHFWEVLVGSEEGWSVGIARKSVERKDPDFGPNAGIWEVGKLDSTYSFSADNNVCPYLMLSKEPKRVRVTLNYEGGRVAFYDADSAALIYKYPPASFSGEILLPFFYVYGKAQLELSL